MVPPNPNFCFGFTKNIKSFEVQTMISLAERKYGLIVVGKAYIYVPKNAYGASQYTQD